MKKRKKWIEARLRGAWEKPYYHKQRVLLPLEIYRAMFRRGWVYQGREVRK